MLLFPFPVTFTWSGCYYYGNNSMPRGFITHVAQSTFCKFMLNYQLVFPVSVGLNCTVVSFLVCYASHAFRSNIMLNAFKLDVSLEGIQIYCLNSQGLPVLYVEVIMVSETY